MKGTVNKCHLMKGTHEQLQIAVWDSPSKRSCCEKLLWLKIISKLIFDDHVKTICSKASDKPRTLFRTLRYKSIEKRKILVNSFFNAHFNYCPLMWMLHSCSNNDLSWQTSSEELLRKGGSVHYKKFQTSIEMYKVKNYIAPEVVSHIFCLQKQSQYNMRQQTDFRMCVLR